MGDRLANVRLVLFFTRACLFGSGTRSGSWTVRHFIAEWHRRSVDHIRDLRDQSDESRLGGIRSPIAGACPPGSMSGI